MTEFEIVSAIKNYVTSQRGVTGFSLKNAQIADEVATLRMRGIDELDRANRFRKPYQGYVQKIEFTVDNTKKITLPKIFIKEDGSPAIDYIGGKNDYTPFRIITGSTHAGWISHDEFLKDMPTVQVEGTEFTFFNFSSTNLVLIAVFEDPSSLDVWGYNDEVDEYPLPGKMQDVVIGKTAESYLRTMYRIPPQVNNQVDAPQAAPTK